MDPARVQCSTLTQGSHTATVSAAALACRSSAGTAQSLSGGLRRNGGQGHRVEISLDPLAFVVDSVHLVAAAIDLDPAHLPALIGETLLQGFLRLPAGLRTRVAGGQPGRMGERSNG